MSAVSAGGHDVMECSERGCLIAIVGPSGVGKDSLIDGARAQLPGVHFMRRSITRPSDAGGEDHHALTEAQFTDQRNGGQFLFDWQAHGLSYGISIDAMSLCLQGHTVVFNGSRHAVARQRLDCPQMKLIWVTANHGTRADRLAARGRETREEIIERLSTDDLAIPADAVLVENDGSMQEGIRRMATAIRSLVPDH